eukprot:1080504-Rhodomonas_salina.3
MSQRLALPQHLRQPPRSLSPNQTVAQIKMCQSRSLPQRRSRKRPCATVVADALCGAQGVAPHALSCRVLF